MGTGDSPVRSAVSTTNRTRFLAALLKPQPDHLRSILRQPKPRNFSATKPSSLRRVVRRRELSRNSPAQKINQHIMVAHALIPIAQHPVIHAQQFTNFHAQASFLQSLPNRRLPQRLTHFQHPAGDGPLPSQRRMSSPDQHHPIPLDDDRAHSHHRRIWIFTFHAMKRQWRSDSSIQPTSALQSFGICLLPGARLQPCRPSIPKLQVLEGRGFSRADVDPKTAGFEGARLQPRRCASLKNRGFSNPKETLQPIEAGAPPL